MGCKILKSIRVERQTFVVCIDGAGTLQLKLADPQGVGCSGDRLASASLDPLTGRYAIVEHDVYVAELDLLQDALRGECDGEMAAVDLLSSLVH